MRPPSFQTPRRSPMYSFTLAANLVPVLRPRFLFTHSSWQVVAGFSERFASLNVNDWPARSLAALCCSRRRPGRHAHLLREYARDSGHTIARRHDNSTEEAGARNLPVRSCQVSISRLIGLDCSRALKQSPDWMIMETEIGQRSAGVEERKIL